MSIENITLFSELHAEPKLAARFTKKAFDKIDQLELPAIERVKIPPLESWGWDDHRKRGFCQCS